jgi:hypothetical protein
VVGHLDDLERSGYGQQGITLRVAATSLGVTSPTSDLSRGTRASSGESIVTTTQRSRLGLLLLVIFGTIAVPTFAATTSGVNLFGSELPRTGDQLLSAPPPIVFVVLGVSMVAWAVGRRHLKSLADLRSAESDA